MNKLVKGSIAGAAGIALLLGGAGTFALWSDSTSVHAGTVSSGELNISSTTTPAAGVWTDADGTIDNFADFKIVPGDVLNYTETFTVKAKGDNLHATIVSNIGTIVQSINGATVAPSFTVTPTGSDVALIPVAGVYSFDENAAGYTVTVKISVNFSASTAAETGQNQKLDLSALKIELKQVVPAP